jgi:hypothetical protein
MQLNLGKRVRIISRLSTASKNYNAHFGTIVSQVIDTVGRKPYYNIALDTPKIDISVWCDEIVVINKTDYIARKAKNGPEV